MKSKANTPLTIEMWKATDNIGITATCLYLTDKHKFKVLVSKGETSFYELFSPSFTPTFGMDIVDSKESQNIADRLAIKVEEAIKK